jgi:predicted lipoprotein with Yx(FWY)xxD motif
MKIVLMSLLGILMTSASLAAYGQTNPLSTVDLADGTKILADANGMTVYIFDVDEGSESKCYDACEKAWPPVLAPEGFVANEEVGITVRKDGVQQLTHDGKPIYYYVGDGAKGDINGDGLGGVWHIITE